MRVVLDTNVFISGLFWKGNPNKIILEWKNRKFDLCISLEILEEFARILRDFKIQMPEDMIKEWLNLIVENAIVVQPLQYFDVVSDKKDNKFIDCAVAIRADYIVTGDKHLLDLNEFRGVKIIAPKEFLGLI